MVLRHWSLPESLCDAVEFSHDDAVEVTGEGTEMARVINASDRISKVLCEIPDVRGCVETCSTAATLVGVSLEALVKLLEDVERDVEELAEILRIDVIPSTVYTKIVEAIREQRDAVASHP